MGYKYSKNDIINKIELALGFTLSKWQKEYLFSNNYDIPLYARQFRRNGKTTIYIIKLILTRIPPIKKSEIYMYSDRIETRYARHWFPHEFMDIHTKLSNTDLTLVPILGLSK